MTQRVLTLLSVAVALQVAPLSVEAQPLRGLILDRETGAPVRNATLLLHDSLGRQINRSVSDSAGQFALPAQLRGFHTLEVSTATHENLGYAYSVALTLPDRSDAFVVRLPAAAVVAASMCDTPAGILTGRAQSVSDSVVTTLRILVEWDEAAQTRRSASAVTSARGTFVVCGVPVGAELDVRALAESGVVATIRARIPDEQRFANVELRLGGAVAAAAVRVSAGAVLSGTVRNERAMPVDGAEVALPKLSQTAVTNEQGEFRLAEVTPGAHEVVVRRLGYRELTQIVTVPAGGLAGRELFLSPVRTLDTISVRASAVIPSFEENRRIGLGKFLTRTELEKQEDRKMAEILFEIGAKTVVQGWRAYVGGGQRGPKSLGMQRKCKSLEGAVPPYRTTDCGCFALVYLNDQLIYSGREGQEVPDVNRIVPASVEAIEYYKGAAQLPLKYATLNSECGVLVLHTRRTPGKVKVPN